MDVDVIDWREESNDRRKDKEERVEAVRKVELWIESGGERSSVVSAAEGTGALKRRGASSVNASQTRP